MKRNVFRQQVSQRCHVEERQRAGDGETQTAASSPTGPAHNDREQRKGLSLFLFMLF